VVDDDVAVRDALRLFLRAAGLRVEAFPSAETFLAAYPPSQPGCLVLDVRMPTMSGLELQALLPARGITLPVIVVTGHADVRLASQALRAGAVDFIKKPWEPAMMLERIAEALAQDAAARQTRARQEASARRLERLSRRELEVMRLLVRGRTVKAIAVELDLSFKTVQAHRSHILQKLGADSVADLIWLAVDAGLGLPEPLPAENVR